MPLSEHKNALFCFFVFVGLCGAENGVQKRLVFMPCILKYMACIFCKMPYVFFASPNRPKILPVANEFFLLLSGFPGLLCPDIGTCLRGQRMTERNILRNFAESWKIFRQRPLQTG